MTPVYQTKNGKNGNCFTACVASLLNRTIEEVDVDRTNLPDTMTALLQAVQKKANCKIYYTSHAAIVDGFFKTSERYCIVSVCSCVEQYDPYHPKSHWHVVVCEIAEDGKISLVLIPTESTTENRWTDFGQLEMCFSLNQYESD